MRNKEMSTTNKTETYRPTRIKNKCNKRPNILFVHADFVHQIIKTDKKKIKGFTRHQTRKNYITQREN